MSNCGKSESHCCWFEGEVCQFLERSTDPAFVWSCSLRRELGGWQAVHEDPRFLSEVKPKWDKLPYTNVLCGDWPPKGIKCNTCGTTGK